VKICASGTGLSKNTKEKKKIALGGNDDQLDRAFLILGQWQKCGNTKFPVLSPWTVLYIQLDRNAGKLALGTTFTRRGQFQKR
jgi:hypothetical protein